MWLSNTETYWFSSNGNSWFGPEDPSATSVTSNRLILLLTKMLTRRF